MPCKNPDLVGSGTGSVPVVAVPERSGSSLGSLVPEGPCRELQVQVRFAARLPPRPVNRPGTRGPRHWGDSLPLAVLIEKPPRAASTRGSLGIRWPTPTVTMPRGCPAAAQSRAMVP